MGSTSTPPMPPMWQCDVCREQIFACFEDAVEHEKKCLGPQHTVTMIYDDKDHVKSSLELSESTSTKMTSGNFTRSAGTNPFFAPRTHKSKGKTTTKESDTFVKSTTKAVNPFFAPKKSNKVSKSSTKGNPKRKIVQSQNVSVDVRTNLKRRRRDKPTEQPILSRTKTIVSADEIADQQRPLFLPKEMLASQKDWASIFPNKSTKQILAEQHQAEFQAKREAERRRERQRQAKRDVLFAAKNGNKEHTTTKFMESNGVKFSPSPTRKYPSNKVKNQNVTTNQSTLPLALRFPVPNHVWSKNDESSNAIMSAFVPEILPPNHLFYQKWKSTSVPKQTHLVDTPWRYNPQDLDILSEDDSSRMTSIQQTLHQVLLPPVNRSDTKTGSSLNDTRLWVDKYGMEHGLVGTHTTKTSQQLMDYLNHWKRLRKEATERMAEKQRKRKAKFDKAMGRTTTYSKSTKKHKKRANESVDDDGFWDDHDDEYWEGDLNDISPLCLLVGPPSSGKTSIVHYVAKKCSCSVVEINTTDVRSGAALKNAIEEATKSSSLDTLLGSMKSNQDTAEFFSVESSSKHPLVVDSDPDDEIEMDKQKRNESSMAVVLIDEADIVFDSEGDSGFWGALSALARTSKSPIIMTANHCPPHLKQISTPPWTCLTLKRPTPMECVSKILQICRQEEIDLNPAIQKQGHDVIHDKLEKVASACRCDLRKLMHELQSCSFSQCTTFVKLNIENNENESENRHRCSNRCTTRPTLESIDPWRVRMDKFTVVTVKGKNFGMLSREKFDERDSTRSYCTVCIGSKNCSWKVLDDETLVVLCPPYEIDQEIGCKSFYSRLMKRIIPLCIHCPSVGLFKTNVTRIAKTETLVHGASNNGSASLVVEYVHPADFNDLEPITPSNESIEEVEFGNEAADHVSTPAGDVFCIETSEEGKRLWDGILSKLSDQSSTSRDAPSFVTSDSADQETAATLRECFEQAKYSSDAALLEDFQDGIPYVSGTCKGSGYDLTEDCLGYSIHGDKLRLHDNARPPNEEKLYETGWKEYCYFYGDPEAYMTAISMKEGKQANSALLTFRGSSESVTDNLATVPVASIPLEETKSRDDLDFNAHHVCRPISEDMYLPRPIPPLLKCLPTMLSQSAGQLDWKRRVSDVEEKKLARMDLVTSHARCILPELCNRTGWSYGRLGLHSDKDKNDLVLELLPFLRRVGLYEQASEFATVSAGNDTTVAGASLRRSTRHQAKARRHHYFDKLSVTLRRDEADFNSSELGTLLAQGMMVYTPSRLP